MAEANKSNISKIMNGVYAACGGAVIATGVWLVTQAFDWNQWRGAINHRVGTIERAYRQDIRDIKTDLKELRKRLDKYLQRRGG